MHPLWKGLLCQESFLDGTEAGLSGEINRQETQHASGIRRVLMEAGCPLDFHIQKYVLQVSTGLLFHNKNTGQAAELPANHPVYVFV